MKKLVFFICLVFFLGKSSFACSCLSQGFCQSYSHFYQMAVSCVIVDVAEYETRLKIIQTFHGIENRDTITVWDIEPPYDPMCNDTIFGSLLAHHLGNIGDTIIVALNKIDSAKSSWQVVGDYAMPGFDGVCMTHKLSVKNGMVQGFVSGYYCAQPNSCIYSIAYDEFLVNVGACSSWVGIEEEDISKALTVFPNPASQTISVDCGQYRARFFNLFDVSGRIQSIFFEKQDNLFSANIRKLTQGMYFLQIQLESGELSTKKFVKE